MAESKKIQPQDPAQATVERADATDQQRTTGRKTMYFRGRRKLMVFRGRRKLMAYRVRRKLFGWRPSGR